MNKIPAGFDYDIHPGIADAQVFVRLTEKAPRFVEVPTMISDEERGAIILTKVGARDLARQILQTLGDTR